MMPYLVIEDVGISDNPGDKGIGLNLVRSIDAGTETPVRKTGLPP